MTLEIEYLGGNCPVQAEGTVNGVPFYFRARGECWCFGVGDNPVAVAMGNADGWMRWAEWGDGEYAAGWMPVSEAEALVRKCAAEYMAEFPDGAA